MKNIPFIVCLLIASAVFGQKIKKVVVENDIPEYKEVFYVLVDSPDVKHGEYIRAFTSRYETRETGQYSHGRKAGIWTFTGFNRGVEQEIDFSSRKIISAEPFNALVSSSVIKGDSIIENRSPNLPLLLGGQSRMSHIFVKYMRYPAAARRVGIDGTVYISATVTKDGKLVDEQIEKGIGYGLDEEAIRIIKMLPDEWLPVGWENEPQECKIVLQVKFKLN